jgi:cell division protein FtsB
MANVYASPMPARSGRAASPSSRGSRVVKRRRVLLVVAALLLTTIAILANYGPVQAYRDAKARLDKAATAVAALEAEKAELQSQLGKLSEADYLESLARQDLSYARPGEELYIVTGLEAGGTLAPATENTSTAQTGDPGETEDTAPQATGSPGFLERVLAPLIEQL